jgi:hypothetical protein
MKMKKNAATAALKPTEKTSPSGAPKSTFEAPKSTPSAPKPTFEAAKSTPGPLKATSEAKTNASAPKSNSGAVTTIEVKIDVGFGNALFLRGQGSGLTWEHGVPLSCVDGGTWRWSQTVASPITFKVLLNDQVWSAGTDLVVAPGQKLEVPPSFAEGLVVWRPGASSGRRRAFGNNRDSGPTARKGAPLSI